jgi:UDP-N-acetylmuramyl pentapeptide phosphotransferase/UDP-N-acetylglucosamine-1-phosphate transferase
LGLGLAAACGGVLPWNFPRARVFLGDTGSHVVGYLLAGLVVENWAGQSVTGAGGVVAPLWAVAVPVADFGQVTFRRWRRGQALWTGDTTHLSHELARRGLGPVGAVVVLWAAAALAGSVGLAVRFWAAH